MSEPSTFPCSRSWGIITKQRIPACAAWAAVELARFPVDAQPTVSNPNSNALVMATATTRDRKSTRLNSSHSQISYAVFCLKKKQHHTTSRHDAASNSALLLIVRTDERRRCVPRSHVHDCEIDGGCDMGRSW